MPNAKYRILSTKPLPQMLVQHAAERGIGISEQPFIDIQPVITPAFKAKSEELSHSGGTLVFTSPNAVKIVAQHARWHSDTSVYCLQGATRKALEELMPGVLIAGTAAYSRDLAELIIAEQRTSSVVFFCGNIRRNELPDLLRSNHITVEEIVVYATVETPAALKEEYDGILFLSSSSVKSFFSVNKLPKHTVCFAIGSTTAASLKEVTSNRIIVSSQPTMDLLVQTAIFYFDNINCYE